VWSYKINKYLHVHMEQNMVWSSYKRCENDGRFPLCTVIKTYDHMEYIYIQGQFYSSVSVWDGFFNFVGRCELGGTAGYILQLDTVNRSIHETLFVLWHLLPQPWFQMNIYMV
jgi:hypothetical protein